MITASVVTFNTPHKDIDNLLKSINASSIDVVYIIDNSSNDELRDYLKHQPKVRYIKNVNNGYGAGHNLGINKAIGQGSTYHVVINPDIFWDDRVIEKLVEFMDDNTDCGLVIPKNCNPDGTLRYVCRLIPTPYNLFVRRFIPINKLNEVHDRKYQLRWTGYEKIMEVPVVSGCFMFMRTSVLSQVGGFDDRYFMYMEDVDLSRRIGEISRVMYCPQTFLYHLADRGSYKNFKLLKYHLKAAIKYFNKWGWIIDTKRNKKNKETIMRLTQKL